VHQLRLAQDRGEAQRAPPSSSPRSTGDIQFAHIRSPHDDAMPLLMTHCWPGSIIELLKVLDPLTYPTAYGGRAEDAFHLVLPTMPGHRFSGKPTTTGWSPARMASAFHQLMLRLGYPRYVSQGGDLGRDHLGAPRGPGRRRTPRHPRQHARNGAAGRPPAPPQLRPRARGRHLLLLGHQYRDIIVAVVLGRRAGRWRSVRRVRYPVAVTVFPADLPRQEPGQRRASATSSTGTRGGRLGEAAC
jgi:hypothetical protein